MGKDKTIKIDWRKDNGAPKKDKKRVPLVFRVREDNLGELHSKYKPLIEKENESLVSEKDKIK